jgi:hypothetical protein
MAGVGASRLARPLAVAAHPLPSSPFHREAKGPSLFGFCLGVRLLFERPRLSTLALTELHLVHAILLSTSRCSCT